MKECNIFETGSRKWKICRHEADLPGSKMDSYRVMWGLQPILEKKEPIKTPELLPQLIFHGRSLDDSEKTSVEIIYGPGTELLLLYKSAGVPSCDACMDLAKRMNNIGVSGCRSNLDSIAAEILPRAMEWLKNEHPWAYTLLPNIVSETAALIRIKSDVSKAIDIAESTMKDRKSKKLNIYTGQKNTGCSSCSGKTTVSTQVIKRNGGLISMPLIGKPIERDKLVSHIMYHVMPVAGNTEWVWRRHCDWIRQVRENYNGRLIIGVVTEGKNDTFKYHPPEAVKEALAGLEAEFITAPNDTGTLKRKKKERQGIGEGVLFPKMLELLQTDNPNHVAFYGHCKGVTRPNSAIDSAVNLWAVAMFDTLFRNKDEAINALDNNGVCGPFRMPGGYRDGQPGIGSKWFFSGTFFATRLVDAFNRNWRYLPTHYGCVEQWPRLNFDQRTQSSCLFFDNVSNLYDEDYWRYTVTPAFEKWKAEKHGSSTTS